MAMIAGKFRDDEEPVASVAAVAPGTVPMVHVEANTVSGVQVRRNRSTLPDPFARARSSEMQR